MTTAALKPRNRSVPGGSPEALFRTRTGDPLLTMELRGGTRGQAQEAAGTKISQTEGFS